MLCVFLQQEMPAATLWLNIHEYLLLKGQMAKNSFFEPPIRWLMSKIHSARFFTENVVSPQGFPDIRNDRRAFRNKTFPPIWADAEWIYDHLAEGGGHFLLPYWQSRSIL